MKPSQCHDGIAFDGHQGRIINVTSVRHRVDLAYAVEHAELMRQYPNYRYLPFLPGTPKISMSLIQVCRQAVPPAAVYIRQLAEAASDPLPRKYACILCEILP